MKQMRKIAKVTEPNTNAVRLMLYDTGKDSVYVFGYNSEKDSFCSWDCHYNDLEDAFEMGLEYGIHKEDWIEIAAPLEHCQHDWIQPVRVIGRPNGSPQLGRYEQLIDGQWIQII